MNYRQMDVYNILAIYNIQYSHKEYTSINSLAKAVIIIGFCLESQNGKYRYWGIDRCGTIYDSHYDSITLTVIPEHWEELI